jgi:hypothetical protein
MESKPEPAAGGTDTTVHGELATRLHVMWLQLQQFSLCCFRDCLQCAGESVPPCSPYGQPCVSRG